MANNFTDSKSLDGEGLSLYDALVKHWAGVNDYTFATDEQIDELFTTKLVPWSTGTDEEIAAMIDGYYEGNLTLEQIQSVWSVGDSRTVNLAAMEATGVGESHRQQDVELIILDFDHDELATSINNKNKALISVQLKNCLMDIECEEAYSNEEYVTNHYNSERGYIDSSSARIGWKDCARRTWCNTIFLNALPFYLQNLVKPVYKQISIVTNPLEINEIELDDPVIDSIWLLSGTEIGAIEYLKNQEGYKYEWFKNDTTAYAYKKPRQSSSEFCDPWWTRSISNLSSSNKFVCIRGGMNINSENSINESNGIAPAFCL